jgi:hypothetical protein
VRISLSSHLPPKLFCFKILHLYCRSVVLIAFCLVLSYTLQLPATLRRSQRRSCCRKGQEGCRGREGQGCCCSQVSSKLMCVYHITIVNCDPMFSSFVFQFLRRPARGRAVLFLVPRVKISLRPPRHFPMLHRFNLDVTLIICMFQRDVFLLFFVPTNFSSPKFRRVHFAPPPFWPYFRLHRGSHFHFLRIHEPPPLVPLSIYEATRYNSTTGASPHPTDNNYQNWCMIMTLATTPHNNTHILAFLPSVPVRRDTIE